MIKNCPVRIGVVLNINKSWGDKFILCTDGLTNMVSSDDILTIAGEASPREGCTSLVKLANQNGGEDNISIIIAEIVSIDGKPLPDEDTEGL